MVRHQNIRMTYAELRRREDAGPGFLRLGLKPGEPHRHLVPEQREWVLAQFATAKAGLVMVNINPFLPAGERTGIRAQQGGLPALILSPASRAATTWKCCHLARTGGQPDPAGTAAAHRLPKLEMVIRLGTKPPAACSTSTT